MEKKFVKMFEYLERLRSYFYLNMIKIWPIGSEYTENLVKQF